MGPILLVGDVVGAAGAAAAAATAESALKSSSGRNRDPLSNQRRVSMCEHVQTFISEKWPCAAASKFRATRGTTGVDF